MIIDPGADPEQLDAQLVAMPGIGPWTSSYIRMRALGDPDAFMPTDLGIKRAAAALGEPDDAVSLTKRAERWRPWRSYALCHLWSSQSPTETSVGRQNAAVHGRKRAGSSQARQGRTEHENRKRRECSMTDSTTVKSPIGTLLVESNGRAINQITLPGKFPQKASVSPTSSNADSKNDSKTENRSSAVLARAVKQLDEYFAGNRTEFDLPFELEGTAFQKDVWLALAEIPYGKTISYAELASMVGRPSAFRAVGQANGANPIPIVLPCHRVIASGGGIGGYGGGLDDETPTPCSRRCRRGRACL